MAALKPRPVRSETHDRDYTVFTKKENEPVSVRVPKGLTEDEVAELLPLLADPYDFIDDDRFYEDDAERRIMREGPVIEHPSTAWYGQLAYDPRKTPREMKATALPLLTPSEERWIFLRFNWVRFKAEAIRGQMNFRRFGVIKAREFLALHRQACDLRDTISEYNLGLVLAMARRLPAGYVDFPEMISEGNMALLRGIDKFNVSKGFKFSTYACRAILKAFSRTGIKATKYKSLFPVGFEPDLERSNFQGEKNLREEKNCASEVRRIYDDNTADLSDLEIAVIGKRFAFDEDLRDQPKGLTLQQVGKMVGLTKERVRQIQITAIEKIKDALQDQYLEGPTLGDRLRETVEANTDADERADWDDTHEVSYADFRALEESGAFRNA